jgi:urease accessory protein
MTTTKKRLVGSIKGRFTSRNHKTVLVDRFHSSPLKISKTFYLDDTGQLYVYMMDSSPGMLDGDYYHINMEIGDGCEVYLTNQSAQLLQTFHIGQNALFEFFPEPLIPYTGSRYEGITHFHLQQGATLLFADILTSGRINYEESFQYDSLSSRMEVYREERLIGWDHFYLEPRNHHFRSIGALEHYTHVGAFWIFSEKVNEAVLQKIRSLFSRFPNVLIGASLSASQGITVRLLGHHVWELQEAIHSIWSCCRELLLDKEPIILRK